jgi:hypothetical protein
MNTSYLQQHGMRLGMYENPLWVHLASSDTQTMIAGKNILVSSLINTAENARFVWCQGELPCRAGRRRPTERSPAWEPFALKTVK